MRPGISDDALPGDTQTSAPVSREGSIDLPCLLRLDSPAPFAAILGGSQHGCWLPPSAQAVSSRRSCRGAALVGGSIWECSLSAWAARTCSPASSSRT